MAADPLAIAAAAGRGFQVFECEECATKVRQALLAEGFGGEWIEIRGGRGLDFMLCLSHDGGNETITHNGRHTAIRVGEIVFDNLHTDGVPFEQWLADFRAVGGVVVASIERF